MVERIKVKHKGKGIFDKFALDEKQAKEFAHQDNPDIPVEEMTAEIVTDEGVSSSGRTPGLEPDNAGSTPAAPTKIRKPRSDIGQPRKPKADKPVEKASKRNRGMFFIYTQDGTEGSLSNALSRAQLDKEIDFLRPSTIKSDRKVRIIQGKELTYKCKTQIKLQPIK